MTSRAVGSTVTPDPVLYVLSRVDVGARCILNGTSNQIKLHQRNIGK